MKKTVTSYKIYAPWEYEKEEHDLDENSKKGIQLKKGGCFHSKFYIDENVRYIYQLDYNPKIDDPLQYRESFEEQGWQFINSTYNGWHYFRKLYVEDMEESETKIYTDEHSLYEMQSRWMKLLLGLTIFFSIMAIVYVTMGIISGEATILSEGFIFIMYCITFGLGMISVKRRRQGKKTRFVPPIQVVFPAALLVMIVILITLFL